MNQKSLVHILFTLALAFSASSLQAELVVDLQKFGKSLGGWDSKGGKAAVYEISASKYRTFKPDVTPSPEGGIFVSVRIDHVRGLFASNDFATLEMTFDAQGTLTSTQSSIAIQGRKITSDVIRSGSGIGNGQGAIGGAVKMGGELVANLTEKLSRENVVEAGRVTFPAAVRHNYNHLFQAVSKIAAAPAPLLPEKTPATPGAKLEIKR
jgi:hypothetical protein